MDQRGYNAMFQFSSKRKDEVKPELVDLFGHIVNENYVALPNFGRMDTPEDQAAAEQRLAAQPQQQPQQEQEQQEQQQQPQADINPEGLINDVLNQDANPEIAQEILHEVLIQNDDATDPILTEIDQFKEQEDVHPEVSRPEGTRDLGGAGPSVPSVKDGLPASDSSSTDTEEIRIITREDRRGKRPLDEAPKQTRPKRVRTSAPAFNIGGMPASNAPAQTVPEEPTRQRPTTRQSKASEKENPFHSMFQTTKQSRLAAQKLYDAFAEPGHEAGRKAVASMAIPAQPAPASTPLNLESEVARLQSQHTHGCCYGETSDSIQDDAGCSIKLARNACGSPREI